jgi:hypothetical protein
METQGEPDTLFHAPTALPPENYLNIFEMKLG